jgi:hypothetical protein
MYFGVLAVGSIGAIIARLQPRGMARALFVTALTQALIAAIALIAGLGLPWSGPAEILVLNGSSSRCLPDRPGCFGVPRVGALNGAAPNTLAKPTPLHGAA